MAPPEHLDTGAIQLRLLALVFPVLRHDAVQPMANAKLAVGMLANAPAASAEARQARSQRLLGEVDQLLDDGVAAVRDLGDWFADSGRQEDLCDVLRQCRALLFAELRTGQRIALPEESEERRLVPLHAARYVLLGWLLLSLRGMPPGATLGLNFDPDGRLVACVSTAGEAPPPAGDGVGGIGQAAACRLAEHFGWTAQGDGRRWMLAAPAPAGA